MAAGPNAQTSDLPDGVRGYFSNGDTELLLDFNIDSGIRDTKTPLERVFINGDKVGRRPTCTFRQPRNGKQRKTGRTVFTTNLEKIGSVETRGIGSYFTICTLALTEIHENNGRRKRPYNNYF